MSLAFLRLIDRWAGLIALALLALPLRLVARLLSRMDGRDAHHVFIKMKGGGSLIIAMPALLGLRRASPGVRVTLVCTESARIYAELTGLFDDYLIVDDRSAVRLILSSLRALRGSFGAAACIDMEPNSHLAAFFALLTCARRRAGLAAVDQPLRPLAYTDFVAYDPAAPIYDCYDALAQKLGAMPAPVADCRAAFKPAVSYPLPFTGDAPVIGVAAITSDYLRERMMPPDVWARLLRQAYGDKTINLIPFGSAANRPAIEELAQTLRASLPHAAVETSCVGISLPQTMALIAQCSEIWSVDSGLLHIARLLGIPTRSFWGPTRPAQRLRPMPDLREEVRYRPFACSPCGLDGGAPPCGGQNLCMTTMAEDAPDLAPSWARP